MRKPDPRVDSIVERIVLGKDLTWERTEEDDREGAQDSIAGNLVLLADVERFHRQVHDSPSKPETEIRRVEEPLEFVEWGPLEVRERLGEGGFGEVYRAWDPALEREVALKLLRADHPRGANNARAILEEARTLAKIRHENIVTVYGVETHDDRPGYWMELVRGQQLEQHLQERGPMGAEEARHVALVLCKALAKLHGVGLIHRDVKTTNVVRETGGRIVLMDFGTVIEVRPDSKRPAPISGTPMYMAPELLSGSPPDRRSDIYSLGVLLHRLVTGEYPLESMPLLELERAHRRGERRHIRDSRSDLPSEFCEVVDRATHPQPDLRYQTVGELEAALSGTQTFSERSGSGRRWLLVAAMLAVALIGGWALKSWLPSQAEPLVVDASFFSFRGGDVAPVGDGMSISVGDALWMKLTMSEEAYVYVLNRDENGEVNLLFPLSGYDLQNPLPRGREHELPGRLAGARKGWRVSSDGGSEDFVIVASTERLEAFEASLEALPQAGDARVSSSLVLGSNQVDQLVRGVAETTDLSVPLTSSTAGWGVFESAARLGTSGQPVKGAWVRRVTLVHSR